MQRTGYCIYCWWKSKTAQPVWRILWQFLVKLNVHLPYDPVTGLLNICPRKVEIYVHSKTCVLIFIVALFVIEQNWKWQEYFLVITLSKPWCIHTMERARVPAVLSRSVVSDSATPWIVAHQAPLSMGFSRQEYWSGLAFPTPEDLPDPGMEPAPPAWQVGSLPLRHLRSQWYYSVIKKTNKQSTDTCNNLHGSQGCYGEWKKSHKLHAWEYYVIFSKIHVVFSKLKKKTREREQASSFQGLGIVEDWGERYAWGGAWRIIEEQS